MKRFIAVAVCASLLASGGSAYAATQDVLVLGADLSPSQKKDLISSLGVDTSDYLTVKSSEERKDLEGILASSELDNHAYSCTYVKTAPRGRLSLKATNLSSVTEDSLYNALQTAGVDDCSITLTAPFEISGFGVLTSVYKAYESINSKLDDFKKELANEELVLCSQFEDIYGKDFSDLLIDIKNAVIKYDKPISQSELKKIIKRNAEKYNIKISKDDVATIASLLDEFQSVDYKDGSFGKNTDSKEVSSIVESSVGSGVFSKFMDFFKNIFNSVPNLFGSSN